MNENLSLKDSHELNKKAVFDIQRSLKPIFLDEKPKEKTQKKKKEKEKKDKKYVDEIGESAVGKIIKAKLGKEEKGIFKPPKLVHALITCKLNEAEAIRKVRVSGRMEMELRMMLSKKEEALRDTEMKLRHYERILKSANLMPQDLTPTHLEQVTHSFNP